MYIYHVENTVEGWLLKNELIWNKAILNIKYLKNLIQMYSSCTYIT